MPAEPADFADIVTGADYAPINFLEFYRAWKILLCRPLGIVKRPPGKIIIRVPHAVFQYFQLGNSFLKSAPGAHLTCTPRQHPATTRAIPQSGNAARTRPPAPAPSPGTPAACP